MRGSAGPRRPSGLGDRDLSDRGRATISRWARRCPPQHLHRTTLTDTLRQLFDPKNQRGIILPLAMIILLILSVVLTGLSLLSGQEPLVAGNHLMIAQAQAMAEAGIERAL